MPVYVAFLRAVNVGGTGTLKMTELKATCGRLGFGDVQTYIQSGNVLFRSEEDEQRVAALLDDTLGEVMGKKPGVMIRTGTELDAVVSNVPFPEAKPSFLLVNFFAEEVDPAVLQGMIAPDEEEVRILGREIYVHYPSGSGRSRLKLSALRSATARNLNTVRKLADLARQMEEGL